MQSAALTGIERQLVLDYLIDGNTPVTITPVHADKTDEKNESSPASEKKVPKDASQILPVAIRAEQLTVLNQGVILLKNAPPSIQSCDGKTVKVQFYFNKLGLYFTTTLKRTKQELALVIPEKISRIQDVEPESNSDIHACLYLEAKGNRWQDRQVLECCIKEDYPLLEIPTWGSIPETMQQAAKSYLERVVAKSRQKGTTLGNGLFLIPICRFLSEKKLELQAVQDRIEVPQLLYLSHERLVFGCKKNCYQMPAGSEYAIRLGFSLKNSPVKERSIFALCAVEDWYESDDGERGCAVCRYSSLEKEDERFLYEKRQN